MGSHGKESVQVVFALLSRCGLMEFISLPHGPRGGLWGGLGVAVREVSRAHPPVRTPILLGHAESDEPLPLPPSTAG